MSIWIIILGAVPIVIAIAILVSNLGNIPRKKRIRRQTVALLLLGIGALIFIFGVVLRIVELNPEMLK